MKEKMVIPKGLIPEKILELKNLGKKIILIQGVYDMLHIGHIRFLEKGKELGDILIVGVDSDELTKDRKGSGRPIYPEDERIQTLLALSCVDYVILKELDDDINYLARLVQPDILVISSSTKDFDNYEEVMREKHKDLCKEVVCLPPQATTSTSAKIAKIVQTGNLEFFMEFFQEIQELITKFKNKINE